jgi:uncharacterized RDD family membrane protein YckC
LFRRSDQVQDRAMAEPENGAGPAPVGAERPTVTRLLSASAKGAERVAHAAGVDRALNQAAEEAIVRALRSPTVLHALERAIESHEVTEAWRSQEIAQLVNRLLASDAAGQAWAQFLESEQAQMLVERIAGAPEIRAAIGAQSAGLITDIGVRLTIMTEEFDDALERLVRPRDPDSESDQAGLATRLMAAGIDLALLFGVYSLISGVLASLVSAIFGQPLSLPAVIILSLLGVVAGGGFFAAFRGLAGQTPGMRFLSIRLMHDGSAEITFGCAVRRVLALILALLPLGLGYLAILRDPRRRGWHDRMTGTEVIYDTVARAAPHAGSTSTSAAAARHRPHRARR